MSALVIDASAAVEAALLDHGFELYRGHTLHAPDFLWWEVNSVLHEQSWRGKLSPARASAAIERFHRQAIDRIAATREFLLAARDVARRLGWAKVYDANYVAAALQITGSRLVTYDERLRRGAARLIDIIGPSEI
ncbi:MAG TPA: type II toxin-antitoxin system VapC family toxin [Chloroflexota bacterium]